MTKIAWFFWFTFNLSHFLFLARDNSHIFIADTYHKWLQIIFFECEWFFFFVSTWAKSVFKLYKVAWFVIVCMWITCELDLVSSRLLSLLPWLHWPTIKLQLLVWAKIFAFSIIITWNRPNSRNRWKSEHLGNFSFFIHFVLDKILTRYRHNTQYHQHTSSRHIEHIWRYGITELFIHKSLYHQFSKTGAIERVITETIHCG